MLMSQRRGTQLRGPFREDPWQRRCSLSWLLKDEWTLAWWTMDGGGGGKKRHFSRREQLIQRSRGTRDQEKLGHTQKGLINHGPKSGCYSEDVWECTQDENRKRKERTDPKKYQYLADRGRRIQKSQKKIVSTWSPFFSQQTWVTKCQLGLSIPCFGWRK